MANDKTPRGFQYMVPNRDSVIEHGQQPTAIVRPSTPPPRIPNGGVGVPKKS
ncbi:hypothetical protein [Microbacterium sp. NPDC055599]